eukprot:8672518-Pyramimonas_sp.AAC.1
MPTAVNRCQLLWTNAYCCGPMSTVADSCVQHRCQLLRIDTDHRRLTRTGGCGRSQLCNDLRGVEHEPHRPPGRGPRQQLPLRGGAQDNGAMGPVAAGTEYQLQTIQCKEELLLLGRLIRSIVTDRVRASG